MFKKEKGYLAIALNNTSITIIEGKFLNKFQIINSFKEDIETGIYKNGRILQADELKKIIVKILKENNFKSKNVLCTFDSTEVLTREIDTFVIPNEEEMSLVVSNEINKQLLIDTNDYTILYKKLESFFDGEIEKVKLFVAATPNTLIKELYDFFKDCNLKPKVLDLNANSLENLIAKETVKPYNKGNIVIFETTKSKIKVNILKNGKVRFTRNIDLDELEFTIEDFEKNEKSNNAIEPDLDLNFKMDKLTGDVGMILKFYTSRSLENTIKKAYICGELEEFNKFIKELSSKIEINIEEMKLDKLLFTSDINDMSLFYNNFGILLNSEK